MVAKRISWFGGVALVSVSILAIGCGDENATLSAACVRLRECAWRFSESQEECEDRLMVDRDDYPKCVPYDDEYLACVATSTGCTKGWDDIEECEEEQHVTYDCQDFYDAQASGCALSGSPRNGNVSLLTLAFLGAAFASRRRSRG